VCLLFMIIYSHGPSILCQLHGSVVPKACLLAIPSAILAVVIHSVEKQGGVQIFGYVDGMEEIWTGYTFVMGFLIVFRTNQAHSRFWEGATLINQIRGEWFNATSNLASFCSAQPDKRDKVDSFQQLLIRLMSLLYCSALQQVCELADDRLQIIDLAGIEQCSLDHLLASPDPCETILNWIQRLVVEANSNGVIEVPPPILSRAFQELSRGMVNLNNVRKIKDVPFPFPYAQMITGMLLIHWFVTPVIASQVIVSVGWSALAVFCAVASFWSLYFIAQEIDQPFGDDPNDLRIEAMQKEFNASLIFLLTSLSQKVPQYTPSKLKIQKSRASTANKPTLDVAMFSRGQSALSMAAPAGKSVMQKLKEFVWQDTEQVEAQVLRERRNSRRLSILIDQATGRDSHGHVDRSGSARMSSLAEGADSEDSHSTDEDYGDEVVSFPTVQRQASQEEVPVNDHPGGFVKTTSVDSSDSLRAGHSGKVESAKAAVSNGPGHPFQAPENASSQAWQSGTERIAQDGISPAASPVSLRPSNPPPPSQLMNGVMPSPT